MKKNILSAIALVLAVLSLGVSFFSIRALRDMEAQMNELLQRIPETQQTAPTAPAVTDPESTDPPVTDAPVQCEHYCNLIVSGWSFDGAALTVSSAFAQVMAGPGVTVSCARAVLTVNGVEFAAGDLTLHPGEGSDSFELDLEEAQYQLPELTEADHLELRLEVTLSDGCTLAACGSSWDYENGELLMIAG